MLILFCGQGKVSEYVCFEIIIHLKVIYTSNNNIDKRNGYTIQ